MFEFISTDTRIHLNQIQSILENDSTQYLKFATHTLDMSSHLSEDEILISILENKGILQDASSIQLAALTSNVVQSFEVDMEIHCNFVIAKTPEFTYLSEWLLDDNFFTIDNENFSKWDLADPARFIQKFISAYILAKSTAPGRVSFSHPEGPPLLKNFLASCRESIGRV